MKAKVTVKRDPRLDPQQGDVLRNWGHTRGDIVIHKRSTRDGVEYVHFTSEYSPRKETLGHFQRMARDAEVIG